MSSFTISFRIADTNVGGRSYRQRFNALVEAVKGAVAGKYWVATTSFFALESNHSIDQLIATCKNAIASTHDLALVLDANQKSGRITGKNDDPDIFTVIPYVKPA